MKKLGLGEKISYALGDFGNGLALASCAFWYLIFLTDVIGLSPSIAGFILMCGRIWEAFINPLAGSVSDKTVTKYGKRRPYLFFGGPLFAVLYFLLWCIPEFSSTYITSAYLLILIIIFNTCFSFVFVPYSSLTASLTDDYNERTSLTGYRMVFSQLAFLLGAALPAVIVSASLNQNGRMFLNKSGIDLLFGSWAGTSRQSYVLMAVSFALVIFVATWICFFGTRERNISESSEKDNHKFSFFKPIKDTYEAIKQNQAFRISAAITLLTNISATFIGVNLPFWLKYTLDMKSKEHLVIGMLFISAIIAIPAWVYISKILGKAETYIYAMRGYCLVLLCMPFIESEQKVFLYIVSVAAGIFYSAGLLLPWSIIPDIVDYDEMKTKKRKEGLFYGGTAFIYKGATALAVFFVSSYLDILGYIPNMPQAELVNIGIKMIIGPLPALVLLVAIFLAKKYPITREYHQDILAQLKNRK